MAQSSAFASVELLERRRLMSGNVSVTTGPGLSATIVGDEKDNAFEVTLEKGVGYRISGLSKTTINGSPAVLIRTASGLSFNVDTGYGNDRVSFNGGFATQDLQISTGSGNDTVSLQGSTHFGSVSIWTSGGNDTVSLAQISVTKDLAIWTSIGNDRVSLSGVNAGMSLGFSTGDGNDLVAVTDSHVTKNLGVVTGNGNDVLVLINTSITGNVGVSMGDGNDKLSFYGARVKRSAGICTASGDDDITLDRRVVVGGDATFNAGNGNNSVKGTSTLAVTGNVVYLGFKKPADDDHPKDDEKDGDKDD